MVYFYEAPTTVYGSVLVPVLAEMLNTTHSNVGFYEKGRNFIATPFLYQICHKYHVSADYLLGRIDKNSQV